MCGESCIHAEANRGRGGGGGQKRLLAWELEVLAKLKGTGRGAKGFTLSQRGGGGQKRQPTIFPFLSPPFPYLMIGPI